MIKKSMQALNVSQTCETFNSDFEKAAINAMQLIKYLNVNFVVVLGIYGFFSIWVAP